MRLFLALEIPTALRNNLAALLEQFRTVSARTHGKGPRWVRAENLHVTLKFIGEVRDEKLEDIRRALRGVRPSGAVELTCRGLGFFPNEKRPQVFWAGLKASDNLPTLAEDVDQALLAVGIAREQRPFAPHLTLARLDPPRLEEKLREAIAEASSRDFGSFQANESCLMESKTKQTGAEYTHIASFPLKTEA